MLFLLAKMSQDPVDDVLLLDASDNSDSTSAATANLNVDIEHTLESLGPGQYRRVGSYALKQIHTRQT